MRLAASSNASIHEVQAREMSRASHRSGSIPNALCNWQAQAGKTWSGVEPPEWTSSIRLASKSSPSRRPASATAFLAASRACSVELRCDHQRVRIPTRRSVSSPDLPRVSPPCSASLRSTSSLLTIWAGCGNDSPNPTNRTQPRVFIAGSSIPLSGVRTSLLRLALWFATELREANSLESRARSARRSRPHGARGLPVVSRN